MATQTLYTFKANLQDLIKLQVEIDKATAKLRTLKKTDKEYQTQQAKVKNLGASFNQQAKAMAGATAQANKMNTAGGKLVNTFKSAAVAIGAAFAVRAIVGSVKAIISTFSEFEAQMAAVRAISGATDSEFKQLSQTALKLGASTSFSAVQVGKLQEEFARLGFTVDEIDAATKATLDLAAATGESLSKSAQIAGSTVRAFGLDAESTKKVVDVMAASFTSSALNLDRFTESMKFVAPVARAVGFTLEETTAILGNLANNGIAGSIAGNGLKNIFLKLGDANSKLAKKLGGTVQGMPQLVEALKELSAEGFSATDAVELLDKRSAPAFLALINNIEGLQDSVEILNNAEGSVTRMAAIRLDTLQGDMTILKSATEGLNIALGEQFDTGMRNVIFSLTKFVQGITESETALTTIRTVVQLVGVAIVALTSRFAAMGIVAVIKNLVSFGRGLKLLTIQLSRATSAQAALNIVTKANPFVLIATLVGTLAGAYFLLGEEASDAERKQRRLNAAFQESVSSIVGLDERTKERSELIREFKDEIGGVLSLMDIEIATNEQLIEIQDLLNKQAGSKVKIKTLQEENISLKEQKRLKDEVNQATIDQNALDLKNSAYMSDRVRSAKIRESVEAANAIKDRNRKIKQNDDDIAFLKKRNQNELAATKAYNELKLGEDDTFRKQKRDFYNEELEDFRKMKLRQQKIEIEVNQDRLTEYESVVAYQNSLALESQFSGQLLEDAKKKTQLLADVAAKFGIDVTKTTGSVSEMNIELTLMRDYVALLPGALNKTGKSIKTVGTIAGFALNKTKDQFKKLSELLDELVDNQFESAVIQAKNQLEVTTKANDEQIALMTSNKDNIIKISDDGNKKEIAALIKANKGKFAAIKTLTVDQYKDAIDGEKGNKDEMLKILQAMLSEEDAKLQTAFAYRLQIYASHYEDIQKIENEREFAFAGDIAEGGEQEARELERSELNFFKAMKLRRNTRETFAAAEVKFIESEQQRELKKLQDFYGADYENNAKYQQQKIELEQKTANEIEGIRQDAQDENVQDQLAAIEKIGQYYGMAFEAFSTFFTNKMELEKQKTNEFYTAQSDDLDTSMERELEAVEGNAEAEEDVRERYSLLQEANEEKKQQELRKIKKKQFQVDKANDMATALINGALAIIKVSGQTGIGAIVAAPIMAAITAAQIAAIASQKFIGAKGGIIPGEAPKFAKGGMVHGASHANGGVKFAVGGRVAELEGGEAVINKRSTAMFRTQLSDMNAAGGGVRFADGGIMPGTSNILQSSGASNSSQQFDKLAQNIVSGINAKEVTVSEASITSSQSSVAVSELTANIF
tara:strand:- start:6283 stop:10257 length:3975 start_codon:yes stop_codon:yes gene_type:complete